MSTDPAPPTYSQEDPDTSLSDVEVDLGPQILIIPATNANFQKGFLGADGERAAIEGELQIKGCSPGNWASM
jgi:hypothetical protein